MHQYLAETGDGGFAAWRGALDVVGQMLERYPGRVNPYTLWLSARRLLTDD